MLWRETISVPSLAHSVPNSPVSLLVDASDFAVGVVSFFSWQLKLAKCHYSTLDRKLLAIFLAVHHFQHQLEGQDFMITNLLALLSKLGKHSPHALRQPDYISQFTGDIRHMAGAENIPTDAFLRLPICSIIFPTRIDLTAIVQDQPVLDSLDLISKKFSQCSFSYLPLSLVWHWPDTFFQRITCF